MYQNQSLFYVHIIIILNILSYDILFVVHPLVKVHNQIVSARLGATIILSCGVEASPRSVNYWTMTRGKGDIGNVTSLQNNTII